MIFQIRTLRKIIAFLNEYKIPFAVIGGIANAERGRMRATEAADLKVLIQGRTISVFRKLAERGLIVSVEVEPGMVVDMLAAVFPYEELAIRRAEIIIIDGVPLPICTAKDLIITKPSQNAARIG